jgi:MFS transporter, UMF1 family
MNPSLPTTDEELLGFYSFGWASEGFGALATAVFFPIVMEEMAATAGIQHRNHTIPCDKSEDGYKCDIKIGSWYFDTSSAIFFATTVSVLIQFFLFISLGSIADHGSNRKSFLMATGYLSAIIGASIILVTNIKSFWTAISIYILSNVFYGATFVFYYAYTPILIRNHPEVLEAEGTVSFDLVKERVGNKISGNGFLYGYIASVIQLVLASGFVLLTGDWSRWNFPSVYGLQIGIAFSCVWQLIFMSQYTQRYLKSRPGPPLPPGENYVIYSYKTLYSTLSKARELTDLFKFLLGWFLFSDAISTIGTVSILYFQTELGVSQSGLIGAAILAPFAAGFGNYAWNRIQQKFKMPTERLLLLQTVMYCALPVYGLLGFFTTKGSLFLQSKWEIYPLAMYHGFLLGASQSSCRVLFSYLLPPGHESEFFGLYELTDKGSAWIGPLVVGAIGEIGDKRHSFWFLLVMLLFPIFIFNSINVEKGKRDAIKFIKIDTGDPYSENIPLVQKSLLER